MTGAAMAPVFVCRDGARHRRSTGVRQYASVCGPPNAELLEQQEGLVATSRNPVVVQEGIGPTSSNRNSPVQQKEGD